MPSAFDLVTLGAEVGRLTSSESHRWQVASVPDVLRVYITLTPLDTQDRYCLRLDFGAALADGPPSVTFCDPVSHQEGLLRDWPAGLTNFFKHPPQHGVGWICNPWTREGRAHHSEWQSYGWRPKRAVWIVGTAVQDILDQPGAYTGRADVRS
ncbi:hypothetical protein [Gemmatimonas sp.]|uniref:hypothetical protein n=1 Tax=Gemmatimonas sp. TaxID=1962908 RepID=UPI00286E0657|nr:hypothetical protein [Gemmatimonas sp.]